MKITKTGSGDGEQYSQFYNIQKKKNVWNVKTQEWMSQALEN